MVSSHKETASLLDAAGYSEAKLLPDICLVVPNVHEVNSQAAARGVLGAFSTLFNRNISISSFKIRNLFERVVMGNIVYPRSKYVALHNVVVDMLLGVRAIYLLRVFCYVTKFCGYKPVLITLNPMQLLSRNINCYAICCYYNARHYNVCDNPSEVLDAFEKNSNVAELWAMGIVASGVVSYDELRLDPTIQRFNQVLVASTKLDRIESLSRIFLNE